LRFALAWSYGLPILIARPTCKSRRNWIVTATPSQCGGAATFGNASRACRTLRGQAGRGDFPPSARVDVVSIATSEPSDYGCTATRWSLDDIAATIVNQAHAEAMSRSTIFRILDDADLKPHRSVYWLNSHDPDFQAKAREVCGLYVSAPRLYEQGRLLICTDEKTGMQILERKYPTKLAEPGKPERREQEYIRHGTLALMGSFVVPTGEVVWDVGQTRTSVDFAAHLKKVAEHFPDMKGFDWVLDNLNTHWSREVCEVVAGLSHVAFTPKQLETGLQRRAFLTDPSHKHVFHFTPKHGSWLNQVELWFSILSRRFLQRGDFCSPEVFENLLRRFLDDYNACYAHPFRWTYTGQPLVRGTPFSATRRQQKQGRAWFSPRPQRFERLLYPPRPYHHLVV
jgi:transposase